MGERDVAGADVAGVQVRRRPLVLSACALAVLVGVVLLIRGGDWFVLVAYGGYGLVRSALAWRPPTQITAEGIRRPWRRLGFVPWTDVSCVLAPQPGLYRLRLQLTDGKVVSLDDIPGDRTAALAAIGGKEVIRPAVPTVRPGPHPSPRPRTDDEVLADVTRQAAALARQREELAAQSRRLRPS